MELKNIKISSSPQISHFLSTSRIMWIVSAALFPAGIWAIYQFGLNVLLVILVSTGTAVLIEGLLELIFKQKNTLADGSAFLTGLLIAYNMPPHVPLFIPIVASFFAIFVVKWSFGGLGTNWMNPALAGRVFVFFSWTGGMTKWTLPMNGKMVDTITGPTPLGSVKTGLLSMGDSITGPMDLLMSEGFPVSYADLFWGRIPGSIGEISAFLLLLGAAVLFVLKIISWEIPVAYLGVFSVLIWIFGGLPFGQGAFSGDILFHLLSGGLILGAFFMATDMVSSPVTKTGKLIFGAGCGFMTFLIRLYGSFPEGVSLAIIFMNIFVPLIDRFISPKRFGIENGGKAS